MATPRNQGIRPFSVGFKRSRLDSLEWLTRFRWDFPSLKVLIMADLAKRLDLCFGNEKSSWSFASIQSGPWARSNSLSNARIALGTTIYFGGSHPSNLSKGVQGGIRPALFNRSLMARPRPSSGTERANIPSKPSESNFRRQENKRAADS